MHDVSNASEIVPSEEDVPAEPAPSLALPAGVMSRLTGVDKRTIRRQIQRGRLKKVGESPAGGALTEVADVLRLNFAKRKAGEVEPRVELDALAALKAGESPLDVALRLRISAEAMIKVSDLYARLSGLVMLSAEQCDELAELGFGGSPYAPKSAAEVIARAKKDAHAVARLVKLEEQLDAKKRARAPRTAAQ